MIFRKSVSPFVPMSDNYLLDQRKVLKNTKNPSKKEKNATRVNCDVYTLFLGVP